MRIVSPSFEIVYMPKRDDILKTIELAGRTCYKSEDKITDDSASNFISKIVESGHHSVIEHMNITVKFVCDRGVSHELVRHRLAAYSQESTRYANYTRKKFGEEITVVKPPFWEDNPENGFKYHLWKAAMLSAEETYINLIKAGAKAQEARSVLPNSLKTEIIMTANIREWIHIFKLRCSQAAHPQIRELLVPFLQYLKGELPEFFGNVSYFDDKTKTNIIM